jgi:hypothetical protein
MRVWDDIQVALNATGTLGERTLRIKLLRAPPTLPQML